MSREMINGVEVWRTPVIDTPDIDGGTIDGTVIGGTTPAAGTFTTLNANDTITLAAEKHLVLPLHNDAATPTLAFGDGNTGFYETQDDYIGIATGGFFRWTITGNIYAASGNRAGVIGGSDASATNPTFLPAHVDANTGIGRAAADQLSLIAGGVEAMRLTEASRTIESNASVAQDDSGTEIATVAVHGLKVDDVVQFAAGTGTLPTQITAATNYYVIGVDDANHFTISATRGGGILAYATTGTNFTTYELEILINQYGDVNVNGPVGMLETVTPSAVANYGKLYTKSDNKIYFQDGAGTEHVINIGATGVKHEFHMPFEDPTGAVGNWDVVEINATQDTHFVFQVSESFETLVNAKVVMIPDATETIQWDINVSVAAAGEAYNNDDDSAADQQLAVTQNQITEVDISAQLTGLTAGDYVAIDFLSDTGNLRIIGFEFDYT